MPRRRISALESAIGHLEKALQALKRLKAEQDGDEDEAEAPRAGIGGGARAPQRTKQQRKVDKTRPTWFDDLTPEEQGRWWAAVDFAEDEDCKMNTDYVCGRILEMGYEKRTVKQIAQALESDPLAWTRPGVPRGKAQGEKIRKMNLNAIVRVLASADDAEDYPIDLSGLTAAQKRGVEKDLRK